MSEVSPSFCKKLWEAFLTTWPLFAAGTVTIVFAFWVYGLANEILQDSSGRFITRWSQFLSGEPNTMGDTLAGFIGSLTLIWVVASVIQQSMELRAQRREFAEMVRAQDAQVKALEAQARIFEDEKKTRDEVKAGEVFEELLQTLRLEMKNLSELAVQWQYDNPEATGSAHTRMRDKLHFYWPFSGFSHNESVAENYFLLASEPLLNIKSDDREKISKGRGPQNIFRKPSILFDILRTFIQLAEIYDQLSGRDRIRYKRFKIDEMNTQMRLIINDDSLWSKEDEGQ